MMWQGVNEGSEVAGVAVMVMGRCKTTTTPIPTTLLTQTPNAAACQAEIPDERTPEAGYQQLPLRFRPKAGRAQRDPIDYDSHPFPSMMQFVEFLVVRFDTSRTRHLIDAHPH